MARPVGSRTTPSYRYHKPSDQAVVTIDGRDIYLGPHGTKASRSEYDRVVGEYLTAGRRLPGDMADVWVVELAAAFWRHAERHYAGDHHGELTSYRLSCEPSDAFTPTCG